MSKVKEVVAGALVAIIISEAMDVVGVTAKIREILENAKSGLQSNKDEHEEMF